MTAKQFLATIGVLLGVLSISPSRAQAPGPVASDAALAARAVVSTGDVSRLKRVFAKARRGEPITISVIGGSITVGAMASDFNKFGYAARVAAWWHAQFPKTHIDFVNAGIGATNSDYGAFRTQRDLLSHHPDFVIVEYSVNDFGNPTAAVTYEGVVRQILSQPQHPALVLLFMMARAGESAQERHEQVGRYYHLPMISYQDGLWPEIQMSRLKPEDIAFDNVHPNDRGHGYVALFLTHYLAGVLRTGSATAKVPAIASALPPPLFTDLYARVHLYDTGSATPTQNTGWTLVKDAHYWQADQPGSILEFDVDGTQVSTLIRCRTGLHGRAQAQVDGQAPVPLEGGGYPVDTDATTVVAHDLAPGKHHVRITLLGDKDPAGTAHDFLLLGIATAGITGPVTYP